MKIISIDDKLFGYLVNGLTGERFESLAKVIFGAIHKEEFLPLGGMHDGGADGFLLPHVNAGSEPEVFFQFSITNESKAPEKIEQTITALKKNDRTVSQLIYATNEQLPKSDLIIKDFFVKHKVLLVIRDFERLKHTVRHDIAANKTFLDFFKADIDSLKHSAESLKGSVNQFVQDPTVFAFLDHELKERFGKDHLNDKILDSLIYWALRDTDPDKGIFLDQHEISTAIGGIFPTANSILLPRLKLRLEDLSKKAVSGEERVRHHRKDGKYCLPFEMRKHLAENAVAETNLQAIFIDSIRGRLKVVIKATMDQDSVNLATTLVFDSVHEYFVEQGLILAAYLENKVQKINISDQIVEDQVARVIQKSSIKAKFAPELVLGAMVVLRGLFYSPSEAERQYLQYLSRSSLLFMTLHSAPKMIEYFNQMGGNFRLLLGADILVKSISESQLPEEQRQVELLIKACVQLGATLVLTEPVLEEIFTHLYAVDLEYRNHYHANEPYLKADTISECNRILIRSYFYARFAGKKITWDKYLNLLLDPIELRRQSQKGMDELRQLLLMRYSMEFLTTKEMLEGVNGTEVSDLAQQLANNRAQKNHALSKNDALMVFATYGQRRKNKESATYDGFGYRTWWLTKETTVLSFTGPLVVREGGVPYVMRPEFLLNFIALAPKAAHVRSAFRDFLPTTAGLQLGQHLKPDVMHHLLAGTEDWESLSEERRTVIIAEKVNRLKYDRLKRYSSNVE